jgi:hypothetical protein
MRTDFLGNRAADADRNANDDKIGVLDRFYIALHHPIGDAEFDHALAGRR